jgi:hypothetical protein
LPNHDQLTTFLAAMFFPILSHLLGMPLSIGLIMASLRMDIQYSVGRSVWQIIQRSMLI